jgi:hypothetical protein
MSYTEYEKNNVLNVLNVHIYLMKHKSHLQNGNQVVFLTNDLKKQHIPEKNVLLVKV